VLADFVAHAPSRFVRHPQLPLDLFSGDAISRGGEQEHDEEPVSERRAGLFKRRSRRRIDLITAMFALVATASGDAIVVRDPLATLALVALAVANAH
jgi:hypothetical protein